MLTYTRKKSIMVLEQFNCKKGVDNMETKFLGKNEAERKALELIIVAEKAHFTLVTRNTAEIKWLKVRYNEFDFPMFHDMKSIEEELLDKILKKFPKESEGKNIILIYFDDYERRINEIAYNNRNL